MHMNQPPRDLLNHSFKRPWELDIDTAHLRIHSSVTMDDDLETGILVIDLIVSQIDDLLYRCMREHCYLEEI